ncbi:MAG: EF-hand domain-containing protein [Phycisphaerales bacterium]|nr:EF-hand domain-containing protein [Phycisphaerales bacterium]
MNTLSAIGAAVVAGTATGFAAAAPGVAEAGGPVRIAGHIYINAATGEVVRTPAGGSRLDELYWGDSGPCGGFFRQDDPARAPGAVDAFATLAVHWGDTPAALTTGYEIAYATNIGCDTAGSGIAGLSIVNTFIADYDGGLDPGGGGASGILAVEVGTIAGGNCTLGSSLFQGWVYTIDLGGTGFEFEWGETDLDGDGLLDFGYGYEFIQNQAGAKGVIGPYLVRPASLGGSGTALGCPDRFDWFNDRGNVYAGGFWFGGGDCSATPPRPYASFFLNLYGRLEVSRCELIDFNGDGVIDFADYLEFLNRYDTLDLSVDLNGDGVVDFADYLEFLNLYDACQ